MYLLDVLSHSCPYCVVKTFGKATRIFISGISFSHFVFRKLPSNEKCPLIFVLMCFAFSCSSWLVAPCCPNPPSMTTDQGTTGGAELDFNILVSRSFQLLVLIISVFETVSCFIIRGVVKDD